MYLYFLQNIHLLLTYNLFSIKRYYGRGKYTSMSTLIVGGFIFFSISMGGAIALFFSRIFKHSMQGLSLICGGFLIGLLALDIVPASIQLYRPFSLIIGTFTGYLLFQLLHHFFHQSNPLQPSIHLLIIALCIHSIPISLTIGSLLGTSALSIVLTASIILHHLPEGFALTTALISQQKKIQTMLLYFISFSLFFTFFLWIGQFTNLTNKAEGVLMGMSIGLLASISISEFIGHNIRAFSWRSLSIYLLIGYLFSYVFHSMIG